MICDVCKNEQLVKAILPEYRYQDFGLENIILQGVLRYDCTQCGENYFAIRNITQLHHLIADSLLKKADLLSGPEIRFLRNLIGYSSSTMARVLGIDKTSLSRIENERSNVSAQVNMTTRLLVASKLSKQNYNLQAFIKVVEKENFSEFDNLVFKISSRGRWHPVSHSNNAYQITNLSL